MRASAAGSRTGRSATRCRRSARDAAVTVRATSTDGLVQPATPNWNPNGFMRNAIETIRLTVA